MRRPRMPRGRAAALCGATTLLAAAAPGLAAPPSAGGPVDLPTESRLAFTGAAVGDATGAQVADAGDVNGDGRRDLVIGAPGADANGRPGSGSAYVVLGGPEPMDVDLLHPGSAAFRIDGAAPGDALGWDVAGAGDVNGDGFADLVVGAPGNDPGREAAAGTAYVVYGSAHPSDVDAAAFAGHGFRVRGGAAGDRLGSSVAGAGDVDGDGHRDVVVGAPGAGTSAGAAYVAFGSATPSDLDASAPGAAGFTIAAAAAGDRLGADVAGAGDVNGDGRADVIVGADRANADAGSAFVVFGSASPLDVGLGSLGPAGFRVDGAAGAGAGASVNAAGDVNGDGRADVVVGSPSAGENGRAGSGSAYVVYGSASPGDVDLTALGAAGFRVDGATAGDGAGSSVAAAGDLNADGRGDLLVGAPGFDGPRGADSGTAYVVHGTASPADVDLAALGAAGFRMDGGAGTAVGSGGAAAGDGDGDGRSEVLLGAPGGGAGAAYLVQEFTGPRNLARPTVGTVAQIRPGHALTATAGTWTNSPGTLATRWQRCAPGGTACTDIPGATGAGYTVVAADVGHALRVVVTATSGGGSSAAASAGTPTVLAALPADPTPVRPTPGGPSDDAPPPVGDTPPVAPRALRRPRIVGIARPGAVLACTTGTWTESPALAVRWLRDRRPIRGASAARHRVVRADRGRMLVCEVTATWTNGRVPAASPPVRVLAA